MSLELGRFVESIDVSPFIDSGKKVWDAICSSSFDLVLAKLGILRLFLGFSSSRVVFTISGRRTQQPRYCAQSPNVRRSGAIHC